MSWFWGSSSSTEKQQPNDPYSKLDPSLKDFLSKESAFQPDDAPSTKPKASPDAASNEYRSQLGWTEISNTTPTPQDEKSTVPPESLYPDGRYAHLWSTYRPRSEIEAAGKNDSDRLRDVIEAYNDRRTAIGAAAIENCVMEQMAERECWETGTMWEKMNMCRGPNRQFLRCYTMQARFLKALGYSSLNSVGEEEERIQMHADSLYHEMIARERAAEEARKEGREVEVVGQVPLISSEGTTKALGENSAWARAREKAIAGKAEGMKLSDYTPERQEQIRKQLAGMNPQEKELEMQLIAAERRAQVEIAEAIQERFAEEAEGRKSRRERGRETVGDSIKRAWGWDRGG
ncbi:hypothetical protein LTR86_007763 [Recurvomyces mirabilis]|nr:hypothetical protein LTR86_007763 [Recurvomyces mirabilis]